MPLFNGMFTVLFLRFYLFIFREGKRGRKRGRETSVCGCLLHAPYWGPGLQPRHVRWLGIEPATLWFTSWHSIHWATPAREECLLFVCLILSSLGSGYTSTIGLLPTFGILSMFLVKVLLMEQVRKYTISVCLLLMMLILGTWSSDCQVSPLYGCCSFCLQLINKIL